MTYEPECLLWGCPRCKATLRVPFYYPGKTATIYPNEADPLVEENRRLRAALEGIDPWIGIRPPDIACDERERYLTAYDEVQAVLRSK